MRPSELIRDPDERRRHERPRSDRMQQPLHDEREKSGKQREIGDEQSVDDHGHPRLEAAVHFHHERDPVQRAGEVDETGRQAQRERS